MAVRDIAIAEELTMVHHQRATSGSTGSQKVPPIKHYGLRWELRVCVPKVALQPKNEYKFKILLCPHVPRKSSVTHS